MVYPIAFINVFLSFFGLIRAYKKKHLIMFIWLILSYYSITSLVALSTPENLLFGQEVRMTYVVNMLLCIVGFLASDAIFNKNTMAEMNLDFMSDSLLNSFFITIEIVFWLSLLATFVELRTIDYNTYNTGNGAGWFQVLFQFTSCIIVRFMHKKQWLKIGIAALLLILIVSAVGVRSLMYFVLMPVGLYMLYYVIVKVDSLGKVLKVVLPMLLLAWISTYVVNMLRFSESRLPETELTTISLTVMDRGGVFQQYFMSALHYLFGLLTPILNALNKIGLGIPDPETFLFPSVPKLNAVVTQQVADVDALENAAHMPGTIYHDLWYCWGDFAVVAAFFLYWYLLKVFSILQKNGLLFFCLSGVFGWHFYMLMRGSVDTCASGIAYSLLLSILVFFYISKKYRFYGQS